MPYDAKVTKFEQDVQVAKTIRDRIIRGTQENAVAVPPLPYWAFDGVPVPRTNTGPNVTQQRIDVYRWNYKRKYGKEIEV